MDINTYTSDTFLFLESPAFWVSTLLFIAVLTVGFVLIRHHDLVPEKPSYKILLPSMILASLIVALSSAASANTATLNSTIRDNLTVHYNLNDGVLDSSIDFMATEEVQEVAKNSAVNDGEVILSKFDAEDGTVKLFTFSVNGPNELESH